MRAILPQESGLIAGLLVKLYVDNVLREAVILNCPVPTTPATRVEIEAETIIVTYGPSFMNEAK